MCRPCGAKKTIFGPLSKNNIRLGCPHDSVSVIEISVQCVLSVVFLHVFNYINKLQTSSNFSSLFQISRPVIIIIIISKTMFMVLSSWQSHCESSPGSFDECT